MSRGARSRCDVVHMTSLVLGPLVAGHQEVFGMTPVDELEQTYRRIYRRLTLGLFVLYGVVVVLAVTVLVGNPMKVF